jgi:SAM-dependent methyltransferase
MTQNDDESQTGWNDYYEVVAGRPPREFLVSTLKRFDSAGVAIDLGCGTGSETVFLLEQGWQVLAVDQQDEAIQTLLSSVSPSVADRLQTLVASFERLDLPPADLIWAGLSLPFCHPSHFESLWSTIHSALVPGGRFIGDFFGPHHAWTGDKEMTFHTKEQVIAMCKEFELEYMLEGEGELLTALNGIQQWHMFTISARLP